MTDIPIIFSGPMVLALLAGKKTMTRRLARRELNTKKKGPIAAGLGYTPSPWQRVKPGDRIWVREAMAARIGHDGKPDGNQHYVIYRSDTKAKSPYDPMDFHRWPDKWSPSIHCPRWASRLTLIVTATKIEPLQDINEADAIAEGVERAAAGTEQKNVGQVTVYTYRTGFVRLWRELHGAESWLENPEVVAITFRVVKANIDSDEARIAA